MRFRLLGASSSALFAFGLFITSPASAASIVVNATDVIYGAGSQSAEGPAAGGTTPGFIALPSDTTFITFSSVTGSLSCASSSEGCITLNGYGTLNDADGNYAATSTSSNSGFGGISGITAPGAGYLVGVFVAPGGPSGAAPASLDYTSTSSESSSSYSPLLDQTFFIGDGLTGDGSGTQQVFDVPTGATELYLGISDAGGYNGSPGSYGDNFGTFTADYSVTSLTETPEPAEWGVLAIALTGMLFARRRLRKA